MPFPNEDASHSFPVSSVQPRTDSPAEFAFDFFLSFAGPDEELARRAYDLLSNFGYKICFQDVDFALGKSFLSEMVRAHVSSRKVIVLLTPNYFATSKYTEREFEAALEDDKLLIFRFHDAAVPPTAYAQIRQDFPDELTSAASLELLRSAARLQPKRTGQMVQRIHLQNLPQWQGGEHSQRRLIGRDAQLAQLSESLSDSETSVVCIIAGGGYGKSSLVQRWVHDLSRIKYAGIDAAFAYSFYKQGWEGGSGVITEPFFDECLRALSGRMEGPLPPGGEKVWQREILDILQRRRVLLILDGLETHQHPRGHVNEGMITSELLSSFLDAVKRQLKRSGGLCLITSRIMPPSLVSPAGSRETLQIALEALDHASSVEALKAAGLSENNPDLDAWADKSGGHPLLISLLAPAIESGHYDPQMFRADQVLTEHHTRNIPSTVQNVVATRLEQIGSHAKAVLYCVALFDRAVSYGELKQDILDRASIPIFTEPLYKSSDGGRRSSERLFLEGARALTKAAMLTFEGSGRQHDAWMLEAHPLVQAGVRCEIETKCLALWRRANWTVYKSITDSVKESTPDKTEVLRKLYEAVPHGVHAGRGKKAGWMYARRCLRGFRAYSTNRGMVADDVALMSNYFEGNWDHLREDIGLNTYARVQAYVWAGVLLTAVNRAHEGLALMEKGLSEARKSKNFTTAARTARFLGGIYAMHGDLSKGEDFLRESIQDLDRHSTLPIRILEWKLVDRNFQRMASHTMLASILHEKGRFEEAETSFDNAEAIQKKATRFSGLRNVWCYRKLDFLLDTERFAEARDALAAASIDPEEPKGWGEGVFVDVVLDLGRIRCAIREADILGTKPDPQVLDDGEIALKKLEQDQGFRMDWLLPIAKIAIAGKARLTGATSRASVPLSQAESLISKSGNIVFRVDLLIERSRLHLACGDLSVARTSIGEAAELAASLKYFCRNSEIDKVQALCQRVSAQSAG